jgi:hypothetical protein
MPIHHWEVVNCHFGGMLARDQPFVVHTDQTMLKLRHVRCARDIHAVSCLISEKMVIIDAN